jgi:hypothetical protein
MIKSRKGHVARMGEIRNAHETLIAKPEGKSPLGRPRRRQEDNIRMDLKRTWCDVVDWIHLTQHGASGGL